MCGITGWIDWQRDLREEATTIEAMTATMACRGPDDQGVWTSPRAALGHRRLAVIDIAGGRQPMQDQVSPDGPAVLTYSGEVYNFRALRTELEGHGHRFRTRSDTEVVLRAYLQWGAACVERFDGMFAFAIWDGARRELLLFRDRFGVKPLYYHEYDTGVLFGSEPKAIIANPLFRPEIDDEGLAELFALFGTHTPGNGVFRGLREVRPGTVVRASLRGVQTHQYWTLPSRPHTDSLPATVDAVRGLLGETVERQLVSDVPLCVLVSGGLDSSAIAAMAAESSASQGLDKLSTFSVDFEGSEQDFVGDANRPDRDSPYVAALVDRLESAHTDVVVGTGDLLGQQVNATLARDLPSLGELDASLYLLFKAVRGGSTVALSGESADEVFGGYSWFHDAEAVARPSFPWLLPGPGLAAVLAPDIRERIQPEDYIQDRYQEALAEVPHLGGDDRESPQDRRMREVSYLALTRFLPVLLDRKDRMSMAVGLEVRVPFCSHRLAEYVWNVPWGHKAAGGVPKYLLRSAVEGLLPSELVDRPKSMYPSTADPGYDQLLRSRVRGLLDADSEITPLLDRERVLALASGESVRPPWMQRLALAYLLQVDEWLRRYRVGVAVTV